MQQAEVGLQFLNEQNLKTSVGRCLVLMPQETVGGRSTRDMERSPPTGATVMQWCSVVHRCSGAVGGTVVTTNRCRLRFNGVPITGLLVDRRLCKANFPLKWNKNTLITLLTPTRRIYVKCIAATFSKTFYQLKIKSWSE